jgi:hypothetical protein
MHAEPCAPQLVVKADVVHRLRFEKLTSLDALAALAEVRGKRLSELKQKHAV